MQNRGSGVKRNKANVLPPNTKILRAEDLVFGSMLHLMKKSPTPRIRINPFVDINIPTGKFVLSNATQRTVDKLRPMLTNKFVDENIIQNEKISDDVE